MWHTRNAGGGGPSKIGLKVWSSSHDIKLAAQQLSVKAIKGFSVQTADFTSLKKTCASATSLFGVKKSSWDRHRPRVSWRDVSSENNAFCTQKSWKVLCKIKEEKGWIGMAESREKRERLGYLYFEQLLNLMNAFLGNLFSNIFYLRNDINIFKDVPFLPLYPFF